MNILIAGFMGSGKSTLLQKLTGTMPGWETHDLDHEISRELNIERSALGDWIRENSLPRFRSMEYQCLQQLFYSPKSKIIALGGGTLESAPVRHLLKSQPKTKLVFLDVPLEICLSRVQGDRNRPMLDLNPADLKKLHADRLLNYQKADLILTPEEIENIKGIDGILSLVHTLRGQKP